MKSNQKLACAVAAVLGASYGGSLYAADVGASAASGIEEIVVTAQRRAESVQNVPITIQAITGAQLSELGITTFEDALRYLPNVTFGSNGPGSGNIFMRGLSAGFAGNQSSATIAPFPNVATYLDDQSLQFPSRNPEVYMVDLERVEVLEGPQGTLFGGGAEAGVVRYITNKPKLNVMEGHAEASYGVTAHGDPNSSANATINLPIIADKFAVRATIYNDRRGGYIDNVPSTFTRKPTDNGPAAYGSAYPANLQPSNNYQLAQRASNPVNYTGLRAEALYQFNEDWSALITQSYQNMEADGEFTQYPLGSDGQKLGPWEVTAFSPAYDKDKYSSTAWTLDGKVGDLKAVYTGSYLTRQIEQTNDYTNYARSAGGFYYSCSGGPAGATNFGAPGPSTCYSPISSWNDYVESTHQSHEFRLSTPDDWRVRGLVGAFYEDFKIKDNMNFLYKTIPSCTPENLAAALAGGPICLENVQPTPGTAAIDPNVRNDLTAFGEDVQRGYKQTAFFGSVDYDLIPKVLTVTAGTRYFHYTEDEVGSQYGTGGSCVNHPNGDLTHCLAKPIPYETHNATYSGFRSRANITWHVTSDTMLYATYSQGFRPGAFSRTTSGVAKIGVFDASGNLLGTVAQYQKPLSYKPDNLNNMEFGWKTEIFDHRLQLNGSFYTMKWKDVQFAFFNPPVLGNTTFVTNGPTYKVNGVELQFVGRLSEGLTLQGAVSYNDSKQDNSPCLVSSYVAASGALQNPTPLGSCITQYYSKPAKANIPLQNPFGLPGTVPAFAPELQFSLRARYEWDIASYKASWMLGVNHISTMYNQPATYPSGEGVLIPATTQLRYEQPGYSTYDAAFGLAKDNWNVEVSGSNLSNSNASTFTSSAQFIKAEVPLRPRVLTVKIGYKF